ncbi:MAG: hypothetical protein WEE66_11235 [Actinomycetota bacterium]
MTARARPGRVALWAGAAGPIGFLLITPLLAIARHDVIEQQGWVSWPSSMALGGAPGVPMIATFLWLGGCYLVFALGALRPAAVSTLAVAGYVVSAGGDALLAFPTDASGEPTSWHGMLHVAGVLVATAGPLIVSAGLLRATGGRRAWRALRPAAAVLIAATIVGLAGGFDQAWAKIVYVVGITLPAAVVPWCLHRATRDAPDARAEVTRVI